MTPGLSVRVSELDFGFEHGSPIFRQFECNFALEADKLTVLQGHNGVGKSVLAKLIAGVEKPSKGSIGLVDPDGVEKSHPVVLYVPQNLESGHDRHAIDLFSSIASATSLFLSPFRLNRALKYANVGWRKRHQTCDEIDRASLLRGILASAALSNIDLLILDEPFAQLSSSERRALDNELKQFLERSPFPTIVIAHPEHTPMVVSNLLLLKSVGQDRKQLTLTSVNRTPRSPTSRPTGPVVMNICFGTGKNTELDLQEIVSGVVNRLVVPSGIAAGRLAALLVQSIRYKRPARWEDWIVSTEMLADHLKGVELNVRLLPAGAQTSVVLSNAPLADSSLFDRWEEAPLRRFGLDRQRLDGKWFAEAADLLPIQHENPKLLGRALSGGNRQLMALRTVSYPFPDILVIASPFAGLDEINTERVEQFLQYAAASGVIVVLVETGG